MPKPKEVEINASAAKTQPVSVALLGEFGLVSPQQQ
jgi:hypothetical protein